MAVAVVDAGPLIAVTDAADPEHQRVRDALERPDLRLVIAALAVGEAAYLIGHRLGSRAEARFLAGLAGFHVEAPTPEDFERIAQLVEQYSDFPLGGVGASVIALAERLGTPTVLTLDRRHFAAVRPGHCESLQLLPE